MKKYALSLNAILPARVIYETPGENVRAAVHSARETVETMMGLIESSILKKKELGEVKEKKLKEISDLIEDDAKGKNVIPADLLQQLASEFSANSIMINACALHPNTPQHLLRRIYLEMKESGYIPALRNLAKNSSTPSTYLVEMYKEYKNQKSDDGAEHAIIRSLAGNKSLPKSIMGHLSDLPDDDIKYELAKNPSAPEDTLMRLSLIVNEDILRSLINNPSSSERVLEQVIRSLQAVGKEDNYLVIRANDALEKRRKQGETV